LLLVSLCKRRVLFSSLKKKSKIQQIPKLLLLFLQSNPKKEINLSNYLSLCENVGKNSFNKSLWK
jgi:hypothetical protein